MHSLTATFRFLLVAAGILVRDLCFARILSNEDKIRAGSGWGRPIFLWVWQPMQSV